VLRGWRSMQVSVGLPAPVLVPLPLLEPPPVPVHVFYVDSVVVGLVCVGQVAFWVSWCLDRVSGDYHLRKQRLGGGICLCLGEDELLHHPGFY